MAVSISASQTITLLTDVDGDGIADPGDTVLVSVDIQALGGDATGLTFNETLDHLTTNGASVDVSPVAFADSYSTPGNVHHTETAATGLLANDHEFLGDTSQQVSAINGNT